MADETPSIGNTPSDPAAQAISKATVPKKILVILLNHGL